MRETKKIIFFLVAFIGVALLFPSLSSNVGGQVGGATIQSLRDLPRAINQSVPTPHAVSNREDPPQVTARAVLIKDVATGQILYQKNEQEKLPIASLTKLTTALVVAEKSGFLGDELVTVAKDDTIVLPYRAYLRTGEKISVDNLLAAMLINSANDAALTLARSAGGTVDNFVLAMNEFAKDLDLRDTSYENPIGFDDPNHYSTAADLGVVIEEFIRNPKLLEIGGTKAETVTSADGEISHQLKSTNELLYKYDEVVGLKTGYTDEAKGNLALLINQEGGQYYMVVLGSDQREVDAEELFKWVKENFVWQ